MNEFITATSAVLQLLLMLIVGYYLAHIGWAGTAEKKFLGKYIISVAIPASCIDGLLNGLDRNEMGDVFFLVLVTFLNVLLTYGLCALVGKMLKLPREQFGVFVPLSAAANSLLVGMPLCLQLFGDESLPIATAYYMGTTTVTQSLGLVLVKSSGTSGGKTSFKEVVVGVLKTPPIIALLTSLVLLALNLRPPETLMSVANYFGRSVTSLAMVYSGFILYEVGLKNLRFLKGMPMMLLLRLAVAPLICWTVTSGFGVTGLAQKVMVVDSAMPSPTQITVMAGVYGADDRYAATGTALTLLFSFLSIPLLKTIIELV